MIRLVSILALVAGLAGCVAAPPSGYGPDYSAPRTSIGIGVGNGNMGGGVGGGVGVGF